MKKVFSYQKLWAEGGYCLQLKLNLPQTHHLKATYYAIYPLAAFLRGIWHSTDTQTHNPMTPPCLVKNINTRQGKNNPLKPSSSVKWI